MSKIRPNLWFDGTAEDAARFYVSLIPDSRIDKTVRAAADAPGLREGDVMTVEFTLAGTSFVGINGGPDFHFNEAVSFSIDCADQAEVDRYWDALVEGGGEHDVCGWLRDRYGLSWQVIPRQLDEMLESPDRDAARRAMQAMLQMKKIDIATLRKAFEGVPTYAGAPA